MQAKFVSGDPQTCDYTPAIAVSAGDVIITSETTRIARWDIAADALGTVDTTGGIYEVTSMDANGIPADTIVWWDDVLNGITQDITSAGAGFGVTVTAAAAGSGVKCYARHDPAMCT